ncbi:phosphoheptose isomerase [Heliomicrobium modesticaldum Ice1]|uniref:Phosphoheptose isomerase n=1 Tax=Heliobacterium modesticaldum (strain ATCC 51547 / Ice1) TaxID=498761 RepID=B0THI7_HELMI|nr:D-sedoheptulose 7-phosphate isomerase [Heliomicrobium modesticaldum]ABZ83425.1 phosphoheptose isomerase [Heliomicrobium modesticaldum Ice1]
MMRELIKERIGQVVALFQSIDEDTMASIESAAQMIIDCIRKDGAVYVLGNGGSAADSQHFVGEMVGRFLKERKPFRFVALTTNTSILTCIGNDYAFDKVFERQVEASVRPGDVLFAISTSGNSENIILALQKARDMGCITIGLAGLTGGRMAELCDVLIRVPSVLTPRIQECHIFIIHVLSELIEQYLYQNSSNEG